MPPGTQTSSASATMSRRAATIAACGTAALRYTTSRKSRWMWPTSQTLSAEASSSRRKSMTSAAPSAAACRSHSDKGVSPGGTPAKTVTTTTCAPPSLSADHAERTASSRCGLTTTRRTSNSFPVSPSAPTQCGPRTWCLSDALEVEGALRGQLPVEPEFWPVRRPLRGAAPQEVPTPSAVAAEFPDVPRHTMVGRLVHSCRETAALCRILPDRLSGSLLRADSSSPRPHRHEERDRASAQLRPERCCVHFRREALGRAPRALGDARCVAPQPRPRT